MKGCIGWQGLKASEFVESGPFLITGTDFITGKINWATCSHILIKRVDEAPLIHVKNGDVSITDLYNVVIPDWQSNNIYITSIYS